MRWEASRAVGLPTDKTLRLIVIPQALRVIIPPDQPMSDLIKNSSLAIAIGYPDMFYVTRIIVNQSNMEVQMIPQCRNGNYLSISLLVSALMNWYNKRMAIVER